jgi:hypothetical protein
MVFCLVKQNQPDTLSFMAKGKKATAKEKAAKAKALDAKFVGGPKDGTTMQIMNPPPGSLLIRKRKRRWSFLVESYFYTPEPYTYKYELNLSEPRPQPWRNHDLASRNTIYLLPIEFCEMFADDQQIHSNRKMVPEKIEWLRDSIDKEGLKRPCILVVDATGKLRYHDGYHRLTAIQQIPDFTHVPCILQHSTGRIRGYGRPLHQVMEVILKMVSVDNEA